MAKDLAKEKVMGVASGRTRTGEPDPVVSGKSTDNGTVASATLRQAQAGDGSGEKNLDVNNSRARLMAIAMSAMSGMETGDLSKFLESLELNTGANQSKGQDGIVSHNQMTIHTKPSFATGASNTVTGDSLDDPVASSSWDRMLGVAHSVAQEEIENLFKDTALTEEFKEKVTTLFEAAVYSRVVIEKERLEGEFDNNLQEAVTEATEELTTRVDDYLNYIVEQWMEENRLAIEDSLKTEITTSFMKGLRKLYEKHNIKLPKKKVKVVKEMTKALKKTKAKLEEAIAENIQLKKNSTVSTRKEVVEEVAVGLTALQKAKLQELSESIDPSLPVDKMREKIGVIKEHYFSVKTSEGGVSKEADNIAHTQQQLDEEARYTTNPKDPVSRYAQAIGRTNRPGSVGSKTTEVKK